MAPGMTPPETHGWSPNGVIPGSHLVSAPLLAHGLSCPDGLMIPYASSLRAPGDGPQMGPFHVLHLVPGLLPGGPPDGPQMGPFWGPDHPFGPKPRVHPKVTE